MALATGPVENISIRNQLTGTVSDVATGPAMAAVKVNVNGGHLTAAVTADAVEALGLSAGSSVVALIKSTEISSPPSDPRSGPGRGPVRGPAPPARRTTRA